MKFQCGKETNCGITIKLATMTKFQCGKETNCGDAIQNGDYGEIPMWNRDYCGNTIKSKSMMKFQSGEMTFWEMQTNRRR